MPILLRRGATRDLTRIGLVLSPGRGPRRWLLRVALVIVGALIGVGASQWHTGPWSEWSGAAAVLEPQISLARHEEQQRELQQRLERSELNLHLAESRGQELERQLAGLIQQLRESNDELSFFRKNRDAKH